MVIPKSGILLFGILLMAVTVSFQVTQAPTTYPLPDPLFFPEKVPTNNTPTVEGVELGRFLFYDSILSADYTLSCATCHRQEAAFSDSPNRLSTGINGELMARNTMPLFNLAWYPAFFWDGKATTVEEQAFHPVSAHNEMGLDWEVAEKRINQSEFYRSKFKAAFGNKEIDSMLIAKAIAQFERTLISANSKYDQVLRGETYFTPDEYEGFVLINEQDKGNCLHCHTTDANALGTTGQFSNNGLDPVFNTEGYEDKGHGVITGRTADIGLFRIPSLRNIAVTAPYMHDGRFATLKEVLDFYSGEVQPSANIDSRMAFVHQGGVRLTEDEKGKIISFLHTLTDSTFLTNPAFSNPFYNP